MTRFNDRGQQICTRPTCDRIAKVKGYCQSHAEALGITHRMIPAHHALHHINKLHAAGVSQRDISEATGVSMRILKNIKDGTQKHVRKDTLDKLTKTRIIPKMRPVWPLARRIRALRAIGWQEKDLAKEMGVPRAVMNTWCLHEGRQPTTSVQIDHKVREFYAAHQADEARPEHPRTAKHRWPAPLDWDDIDDPDEKPLASRFFPSAGECVRGHELYEFNTFKSSADSNKPKCKSCVSAMNALLKWKPNHSVEDVQWLSDTLFETYRRGDIAYPKALIDGGLSDDQAA